MNIIHPPRGAVVFKGIHLHGLFIIGFLIFFVT